MLKPGSHRSKIQGRELALGSPGRLASGLALPRVLRLGCVVRLRPRSLGPCYETGSRVVRREQLAHLEEEGIAGHREELTLLRNGTVGSIVLQVRRSQVVAIDLTGHPVALGVEAHRRDAASEEAPGQFRSCGPVVVVQAAERADVAIEDAGLRLT